MTNPRQIGLFDHIHPIQADIRIKENHELLRLTKVIPWPDLIEAAQGIRASQPQELSE